MSLPKRFKTSPTVRVSKNSGTEACSAEQNDNSTMIHIESFDRAEIRDSPS